MPALNLELRGSYCGEETLYGQVKKWGAWVKERFALDVAHYPRLQERIDELVLQVRGTCEPTLALINEIFRIRHRTQLTLCLPDGKKHTFTGCRRVWQYTGTTKPEVLYAM